MNKNPNAPRPRINSPLYEDGPWLKDPLRPDMFRNAQIGDPLEGVRTGLTGQSKNKGGTNRIMPEPLPSIGSVHQANKHPESRPSTQYDEVGIRNTTTKSRGKK